MKNSGKNHQMAGTAVLVEIGTDQLKIMQVESSKQGITISKLHVEKFDSLGSGLFNQIVKAYEIHGFRRQPVILCLPRHMVTLRFLELPSMNPEEISGMADIQFSKQTPYSREEIVYDYSIMKASRAGYTRLMMAIVQNIVVRERYRILEEAGLDVGGVAVGTEGLYVWATETILAQETSDSIGLLDVDSHHSDLIVVANGSIVASRSIPLGASHLSGGSREDAGKFAKEVRRAVDVCIAEVPGLTVRKLHVAGATSNLDRVTQSLGVETSLPVMVRESLQSVGRSQSVLSQQRESMRGVSFTPMIGIAMASACLEINLMPDSLRLRKDLEAKAKGLTRFAVLLMALLASSSLFIFSILHSRFEYLNVIRAEVKKYDGPAKQAEQKKRIVEMLKQRSDPGYSVLNILGEVHFMAPENVSLDLFDADMERGQVRISGMAGAWTDISVLKKNLEQTSLLKDAKDDGAVVKDQESGRLRFKIICSLER